VLYYQLFVLEDFDKTAEAFSDNFTLRNAPLLIFAILLMPLNLLTEAIKWRILVNQQDNVTLNTAFKAIYGGIALSIFTPKRIGEYGGRAMVLEDNRTASMVSTFVGNLSQTVVNIMVGLAAFWFFLNRFALTDMNYERAVPVAIITVILATILYFNLEWLYKKLSKWKFIAKYAKYFEIMTAYSNRVLTMVLGLSFFKYLIFVCQYMLLVYFFGVDIEWHWVLVCVSCIFFAKSALPLPASVELLARGAIAVYFFAYLTANTFGILVASYLLWIINLALPAMIGGFLLTKTKWQQ